MGGTGGKENALSGVGATQAPYPLGTQALLPVVKVLLEKVALFAPKALASSAEHLVGRPAGKGRCAGCGRLRCRWRVGPSDEN